MKSFKNQAGVTLIELVTVITIAGILAAAAVPAYIDLRGAAASASLASTADSLSSASMANFALRSNSPMSGFKINTCQDVVSLIPGGLSTNYGTISVGPTPSTVGVGKSSPCTLTLSGPFGAPVIKNFSVIGTD